ncbi:hypothetical protein HK105_204947 [Polyrhizophydium stewartii]|uniref:Ethanolaminephosphotransferase n=1 Tax=Polyrhizophydium stewartii TaxID=2732419 RepID=A0ABR4N7S4_9FUNG
MRDPAAQWRFHPFGVSQYALDKLKEYKYSAMDMSPVSKYIMQPYWTWATTLFPMWIAPNMITLSGFFFVMINLPLVVLYTPDLLSGEPSWIYFSMALGIWLYSTFDNVDGKQARRTGSSSPLGELFDHGIDALNATFATILQAAGAGTGFGWDYVTLMFTIVTAFFFSTWETYYTGTLYLGYINGPTEGLILSVASLVISGIYGPKIWWNRVSDVVPAEWLPPVVADLKLLQVSFAALLVLLFTTQIPVSLVRVREACTRRNMSFSSAVLQTLPYFAANALIFVWISTPGSIALSKHGLLLTSAWGIAFGRMAAKIVLAHVTHTEYPDFAFIVLPFLVGAVFMRAPQLFGIDIIFDSATETRYIYAVFTAFLVDYLLWVCEVIHQFCRHLGIKCLRIPTRKATAHRPQQPRR